MKPQGFNEALPSDRSIVAKALCRVDAGRCPCEHDPASCPAEALFGERADAVLKALSARKRLMVNRP